MLSSLKLLDLMANSAESIAKHWANDVTKNPKTPFFGITLAQFSPPPSASSPYSVVQRCLNKGVNVFGGDARGHAACAGENEAGFVRGFPKERCHGGADLIRCAIGEDVARWDGAENGQFVLRHFPKL